MKDQPGLQLQQRSASPGRRREETGTTPWSSYSPVSALLWGWETFGRHYYRLLDLLLQMTLQAFPLSLLQEQRPIYFAFVD